MSFNVYCVCDCLAQPHFISIFSEWMERVAGDDVVLNFVDYNYVPYDRSNIINSINRRAKKHWTGDCNFFLFKYHSFSSAVNYIESISKKGERIMILNAHEIIESWDGSVDHDIVGEVIDMVQKSPEPESLEELRKLDLIPLPAHRIGGIQKRMIIGPSGSFLTGADGEEKLEVRSYRCFDSSTPILTREAKNRDSAAQFILSKFFFPFKLKTTINKVYVGKRPDTITENEAYYETFNKVSLARLDSFFEIESSIQVSGINKLPVDRISFLKCPPPKNGELSQEDMASLGKLAKSNLLQFT